MVKQKPIPKLSPEFLSRMRLLFKDEDDLERYIETSNNDPCNFIRCDTIKIKPCELLAKLRSRGWVVSQPFDNHPEIMLVESELLPGELGKSREHLLGYFYVQEVVSMMPIIALSPNNNDKVLDLCAAPGSKTTQASMMMSNRGLLVANDSSAGRTRVLAANCERMGSSNVIITNEDGGFFCNKILRRADLRFDKVLVDAPCSGEGTYRSSPSSASDWIMKLVVSLSKKQKRLIESAFSILKIGGLMVYSTCTHAPEENEEVVDYLLSKYDAEIIPISLPIKTRKGITKWQGRDYHDSLINAVRIYPHDNDSEGFFLCLIRKLSDEVKV